MYIGIYDEPYMAKSGPLSFQAEFAASCSIGPTQATSPSVET